MGQGQAAADPAGSRRGARVDAAQAGSTTPAYIRQSRALIITRLEEEVAEARARLDRSLRKFQAADHPVVIRAQETLDALVQRLDRIDRVLVDVVETYPTMVDFSGGPAGADSDGQTRVGTSWNNVKHARWFEGQNGMNNQQRPGAHRMTAGRKIRLIFRGRASHQSTIREPQGATRVLRVTRQTAIRKPDNKGKVSRPMHGTTARSPDRMANSNPATHRRTMRTKARRVRVSRQGANRAIRANARKATESRRTTKVRRARKSGKGAKRAIRANARKATVSRGTHGHRTGSTTTRKIQGTAPAL